MQQLLPEMIAKIGRIDALMSAVGTIGGTPKFGPFDEELLKPLLPKCKIIVSGAAGFNLFDVEWLTKNNIWLCNTRDAMGEAKADMAMFLILAVLKDSFRAERSCRQGTWKTGVATTRSPSGLKLGIVGMGAIGKVRRGSLCLPDLWFTMRLVLIYFADTLVSGSESRGLQHEGMLL